MYKVGDVVTRVSCCTFGGVRPHETRAVVAVGKGMIVLQDSVGFQHDPANYVLAEEFQKMHKPEGKASNPKEALGSAKLPLHLIPDAPVAHVAMAFFEGAAKYGAYNWRVSGVRASTYVAAARRHISKWWNGEDCDPKTKVHHLANAAACCMILMDAEVQKMMNDDRPPKQDLEALYEKLADVQQHLAAMHAGVNPKHHTEK